MHHVPPPATLSPLNRAELEALLGELFGEVATLKHTVAELREEIASLPLPRWDLPGERLS